MIAVLMLVAVVMMMVMMRMLAATINIRMVMPMINKMMVDGLSPYC